MLSLDEALPELSIGRVLSDTFRESEQIQCDLQQTLATVPEELRQTPTSGNGPLVWNIRLGVETGWSGVLVELHCLGQLHQGDVMVLLRGLVVGMCDCSGHSNSLRIRIVIITPEVQISSTHESGWTTANCEGWC